jgi:hypothetical protein
MGQDDLDQCSIPDKHQPISTSKSFLQYIPLQLPPSPLSRSLHDSYRQDAHSLCRALLTASFGEEAWGLSHAWEGLASSAPGALTVALDVVLDSRHMLHSTKVLREIRGGHPTQAVILRELCWAMAMGGSSPKCCRLR